MITPNKPIITLHSYGYRSFTITLNDSEVKYIIQYNNQEPPYRIWKKNYRVAENVLDHVIAKVNPNYTVRTLIDRWIERVKAVSCHRHIEGGTTALFIYGGA